jgi:hypothetical protein
LRPRALELTQPCGGGTEGEIGNDTPDLVKFAFHGRQIRVADVGLQGCYSREYIRPQIRDQAAQLVGIFRGSGRENFIRQ